MVGTAEENKSSVSFPNLVNIVVGKIEEFCEIVGVADGTGGFPNAVDNELGGNVASCVDVGLSGIFWVVGGNDDPKNGDDSDEGAPLDKKLGGVEIVEGQFNIYPPDPDVMEGAIAVGVDDGKIFNSPDRDGVFVLSSSKTIIGLTVGRYVGSSNICGLLFDNSANEEEK